VRYVNLPYEWSESKFTMKYCGLCSGVAVMYVNLQYDGRSESKFTMNALWIVFRCSSDVCKLAV
jgi:hypothetical protein